MIMIGQRVVGRIKPKFIPLSVSFGSEEDVAVGDSGGTVLKVNDMGMEICVELTTLVLEMGPPVAVDEREALAPESPASFQDCLGEKKPNIAHLYL